MLKNEVRLEQVHPSTRSLPCLMTRSEPGRAAGPCRSAAGSGGGGDGGPNPVVAAAAAMDGQLFRAAPARLQNSGPEPPEGVAVRYVI